VGLDAYELQEFPSQWIIAPNCPTAQASPVVRINMEYRLGVTGNTGPGPTGLLHAVHVAPSIDLIMVPPAPTAQKSLPAWSLLSA
jgi:hypothetical protein